MKSYRKCLLVLAMLVCCVILPQAHASSIVLTVVNDTFLPLSTDTMPTKKSGEWYVPYTVFQSFAIASYPRDDGDVLVMQNSTQTVTFSLSQGYTYDQNMNALSQPAYVINDTIYLPVKLMCGQFGLSFSVLSGESTIIRICDANAQLSDHDFLSGESEQADDLVDDYKQESVQPEPVIPEPNTPEPVPPEQPIVPATIRPNLIYLTFVGAPNEFSVDFLDTLAIYQRKATFFLPMSASWDEEFVRRAIAEGHSIGWWLDTEEGASALAKANETLFRQTGTISRIVSIAPEVQPLVQRAEITQAGYQCWNLIVQAEDTSYSASKTADLVLQAFDGTTANTVLALHHERSTNAALTLILRDLQVNQVKTQKITSADLPIAV